MPKHTLMAFPNYISSFLMLCFRDAGVAKDNATQPQNLLVALTASFSLSESKVEDGK